MKNLFAYILLTGLILSFISVDVLSQTSIRGEIGIDLESFRFRSELKDTTRTYFANRSRSGHFVNLSMSGAAVNSNFANYTLRTNLLGNYFGSTTDSGSVDDYVSPSLRGYYGQLTFLPNKPFPLKLYHSKSNDYTLRFETNNRSDRERLQPALGVIRRYKADKDLTGGILQYVPTQKWNITTEVKQETNQAERIYDFTEDKDIWLNASKLLGRPGDSVFTMIVKNDIDDSVTISIINLDSLFFGIDSRDTILELGPGEDYIALPSDSLLFYGETEFQIQPKNYNPFTNTFNVNSGLLISVTFRDPASPNDLDQEIKGLTTIVKYDSQGKLKNESMYEYSDLREAVQKQTTFMNNFTNTATYEYSKNLMFDAFTSKQTNQTAIDTVSRQKNGTFVHQTSVNYSPNRRFSSSLLHSYSRNTSDVFFDSLALAQSPNDTTQMDTTLIPSVISLTSSVNMINGRAIYEFDRWNHILEVKTNFSFLSDNLGFADDKYSGNVLNGFEFNYAGIKIRPKNDFKYTYNTKKNPDQQSNEYETKTSVLNDLPNSKIFGDVKFKTEFSYRNRSDGIGSTSRTKVLFDGSLIKKFKKGYRLSLLTIHENESFGGSAGSGSDDAQESIYKASYKIDLQTAPIEELSLGGNYLYITQGSTKIQKMGLSLIGDIPKINLPIKSFFLHQIRDLESQPRQTQTSLEVRSSYRIRKISLIFSYKFSSENQLFEKFTIHEISARAIRQLEIM